ncbi:GGDEF domain-containing protein [Paenibacillus hamazuiensis]|uniref:GGDEF domain-containing protein n=1 Tax=Paenibacillus hamazuiensis TaxID=2936508 RepID=UPI00200F2E8A
MGDLLIPLFHACTLVTLNYIALKIRNRIFIESCEWLAVPLLTGLASIIMMLQPVSGGFLPSDLRFAPIVMAGLRFGWGMSLLSTMIPAVYSFFKADPSYMQHLIQDLLLPAIISSSFHQKENDNGYIAIRVWDGIKVCAVLSASRVAILFYETQQQTLSVYGAHLYMFLLSAAAITVLIYMFNDENRNWMLHRQLEFQANQDGLTKLPNIRSFLGIAKNTLKRRKISIFMIDIDNFKSFNDTYGHLVGDELLRHVGELLRLSIEEQDYVARYGGEEFIIMSQTTDEEELAAYAHSLCSKVASTPFTDPNGEIDGTDKPSVTISVGISVATRTNDDLQRIISEADEALYVSKRTGKNKYSLYYSDASLLKVKNNNA